MRNPVCPSPGAARFAAAVLLAAAPAVAQTVPGLENFSIERPAPAPVVTPSPSPTTAPAPTAPAPTAPAPTATPTTATPSPRTTPSPTASPSPTPTPSATPDDTTPSAEPAREAAPRADALPPTPTFAPAPVATPTPTTPAPQTADGQGGTVWWPWLILAFGILAGGMYWFSRRNRAEQPVAEYYEEPAAPAPPVAEAPAPPPPPPAAPAPAPLNPAGLITTRVAGGARPSGLVTTALRPRLGFELTPVRAGIDTLRATLDFALLVRNEGRAPAHDVLIEAWLLAADRDPRATIAALLAQDPGQPMMEPFAMAAGAAVDVMGQAATPREQLATITAGERKLFVPLLVVRAAYRDAVGRFETAGAAFMVGVPREGQDRLAPLPLDRGARGYTTLAALRFDG